MWYVCFFSVGYMITKEPLDRDSCDEICGPFENYDNVEEFIDNRKRRKMLGSIQEQWEMRQFN